MLAWRAHIRVKSLNIHHHISRGLGSCSRHVDYLPIFGVVFPLCSLSLVFFNIDTSNFAHLYSLF